MDSIVYEMILLFILLFCIPPLLGIKCQNWCLVASDQEKWGHFSSHHLQPAHVQIGRGSAFSWHWQSHNDHFGFCGMFPQKFGQSQISIGLFFVSQKVLLSNVEFVNDGFEFSFDIISSLLGYIRNNDNVRVINSKLGQQACHAKNRRKIPLSWKIYDFDAYNLI